MAFSALKGLSKYLTEKASIQEKDYFVKQATSSGRISLLTKSFGRGTDFVCYDPDLESNGGIHVIQTFLSEELSEEVQIQGRTARQDNSGSYSMVLPEENIEKFMVTAGQIKDMVKRSGNFWNWLMGENKTVYGHLNDSRCKVYTMKYDDSSKFVAKAASNHAEGLKFIHRLHSHNVDAVKEFLIKMNKGIEESKSRTICLMDATGSMTHLLHKAKAAVSVMFERASEIMKNDGVEDNFHMQFAVYRNYSSKEDNILQFSTWEAQPENLKAFMEKIGPERGQGNEAIEIGLWHAYQEALKIKFHRLFLLEMPLQIPLKK